MKTLLLLAALLAGCTRLNPLYSAPTFHFREQAVSGTLGKTFRGSLDPVGEDRYAAAVRFELPVAGGLKVAVKPSVPEATIDLDLYSDGNVPIATTSGRPDKKLEATDLAPGTYYVIAREDWRSGVATRFALDTELVSDAAAAKPRPPEEAAPTASASAPPISGKLAVLDPKNFTSVLKPENMRYFADVIREQVLVAAPQVKVMTRENLVVLLQASGKDLAQCEGECEVDTGRLIGADAIVSGEIQQIGTRYKASIRLHDTHDGRLVSAVTASGKTIDELDDDLHVAIAKLFAPAKSR